MAQVVEILELRANEPYPYVIGEFIDDEDDTLFLNLGQVYTEFWGGRPGYAVLDMDLSFDETAAIARLAGFSHFRRGITR